MVQAYSSATSEVLVGGSVVQGRRQLYSKFEASLCYVETCFKATTAKWGQGEIFFQNRILFVLQNFNMFSGGL